MHGSLFQWLFKISAFMITLAEVSSHRLKDDVEERISGPDVSSGTPVLLVVVPCVAFLSVLVVVVVKCADCYNSEVSSENHPACAEKEYKWGGAVGYTSANSSNTHGGYRSGEVVEMTQQQSLPYAMIPTSVPSSAGFQGYSMSGQGQGDNGQPSAPLGHQGSVRSNSSYGGGTRHYNPVDPQDPPPAYEAAARNGSFYGNR